MISSSRGKGFQAKQEGSETNIDVSKLSKGPSSSSSSRHWSGFRNPRIVRVSRSFGGKDRHSKVCTIRGLRDRRIRLSVPTAIQLYDLQERLGLSQPSKVIDWLLDATKDDIDKLPPLQMPQGFGQFHQQMLPNSQDSSINAGFQSSSSLAPFFDANSAKIYWDAHVDAALRAKTKEAEERQSRSVAEKGKWIKENIDHQQGCNNDLIGGYSGQQGNSNYSSSAQRFFPTANCSSLPSTAAAGFSNNNVGMPFNSFYNWEPPNLSLSQFGNHGFLSQQAAENNSLNSNANATTVASLGPSSLAVASVPQLFFCPTSTVPSLFSTYPSPYVTSPMEGDYRQMINHFQPMKPFSLNVNVGVTDSQNENGSGSHHQDNTDS